MTKLGVYWSVMHRRPQDYEYFRALQPSVFKIMDGGTNDYQWAKESLPDSLIIARDWAMSEQHADMLKDPVATGKRHASEWGQHQVRLGFDRAKTLILGINEPHVWEPGVTEALRLYTIALCEESTKLGLRVGAMQLSVGWPNNTGPDTPPNWEPWHGVDNAIRANNGALVVHEYWADNGPGENWGWWGGRALKCPWQVPIVIGECGVDLFVKDTSVGQQRRGWLGHMPPERYASELADYTIRMSADARFVGCCVFASDFAAHEWYSFDVEPAYKAILATPLPDVKPVPPPTETHLPSISTGAKRANAYVNVTAGANQREQPPAGAIITAIPYGEKVETSGIQIAAGVPWAQVSYQGRTGWVLASLLSVEPPAPPTPKPQPKPEPSGDNFARSLAFVRKWEGGWADDPNDAGGATNKGITLSTFSRWREAHGQPAPTKDDLRMVADAETNQIYLEWYWRASGADKLPWPLCLAHFDTAVNAGPERAKDMLERSDGLFLAYVAHLITWYASLKDFEHFGRGWMRRRADLLLEASK